MTDSTHATLMRRITRQQVHAAAENPLTASRAVRLALTKAANDAVGLILTVQGVAEEVTKLDDMLGALSDDLMLVGLLRAGQLAGIIALDTQLRAAVVEMQTMGALSSQVSEDRPATLTDKTLCDPLLAAFLSAFPVAVTGTDLVGWVDDVAHHTQIADRRAAGLLLDDCNYRIVRMSVQLGTADRQGQLLIALPKLEVQTIAVAPPPAMEWGEDFHDAVFEAPASLEALLHRWTIPLGTAQRLGVGSILPLPGCTVNSVRLLSPEGKEVAKARLGQIGGMRAVRLQSPPAPQLGDLEAGRAAEVAGWALDTPASLQKDLPAHLDMTGDTQSEDERDTDFTTTLAPMRDADPEL